MATPANITPPQKRLTSLSEHIQHDRLGEDSQLHPLFDDNYILRRNYLVTLLQFDEYYKSQIYRGDIYEDKPTATARLWEAETARLPYLNRIRSALPAFPSLRHLVSWMEVSTSETRHVYLSKLPPERQDRLRRVRVHQLDLKKGENLAPIPYTDRATLESALAAVDSSTDQPDARIYVVEDLSTDILEVFGEKFGIDPFFWTAHIDDYFYSLPTSETAEIRSLEVVNAKRPYFTMRYLRPRYYRSTASFETAIKQAGKFNVLRQLDSDRGRQSIKDEEGAGTALMRAKTSLWIQPKTNNKCMTAIILIDPTPKEGERLLGGYDSIENWPSTPPPPPRTSLYDDVVYWMSRMKDADIDSIVENPKACAMPAIKLILSDWHLVIQYITFQLGRIEWEIEIPAMRKPEGIADTMQKLHPWRRNISLYRSMVAESIDRIFSKDTLRRYEQNLPDTAQGLPSLLRDFKFILDEMDRIQERIERIVSVASALLNIEQARQGNEQARQGIEDGRRAQKQNNNVARLTYLATIFIPLSFVSGFLSMQPEISRLKQTYWIFFTIAIPLTLVALIIATYGEQIGQAVDKRRNKTT